MTRHRRHVLIVVPIASGTLALIAVTFQFIRRLWKGETPLRTSADDTGRPEAGVMDKASTSRPNSIAPPPAALDVAEIS